MIRSDKFAWHALFQARKTIAGAAHLAKAG
jgi:hypothetical protein